MVRCQSKHTLISEVSDILVATNCHQLQVFFADHQLFIITPFHMPLTVLGILCGSIAFFLGSSFSIYRSLFWDNRLSSALLAESVSLLSNCFASCYMPDMLCYIVDYILGTYGSSIQLCFCSLSLLYSSFVMKRSLTSSPRQSST